MKRLTLILAAGLLLAACDTYPSPDPYGPPLPPQDPYGAPYPAPLPPEGPYSPGGYPATFPESCPIASSRDWRASIIAGTDRPVLSLSGTVVAPTGGYRMEFFPYLQDSRAAPGRKVARLLPVPPDQMATQALTTHDLSWQWPLASPMVNSVTIVCGDRPLAEVPVAGYR